MDALALGEASQGGVSEFIEAAGQAARKHQQDHEHPAAGGQQRPVAGLPPQAAPPVEGADRRADQ